MAEENGTDDTASSNNGGSTHKDAVDETSFPANTPWRDMTGAQQVAYWRHQAQRHENRAKNAPSADELAELRDKASKHDALEADLASDKDKAVSQAQKDAEAAADAKYRPQLAETAFRVAIGERKNDDEVNDFIADLNLSRFITDEGRVDTAKVLARVKQFAPDKGEHQQQRKGPTITGHGGNGPEPVVVGDGARAALARRGIKVD